MWRSKDNLQEPVLFFYYVSLEDWTQIARFGSKHFYQSNYIAVIEYMFFSLREALTGTWKWLHPQESVATQGKFIFWFRQFNLATIWSCPNRAMTRTKVTKLLQKFGAVIIWNDSEAQNSCRRGLCARSQWHVTWVRISPVTQPCFL